MTKRTPLLAGLFAVLAALALVATPTAADKDSKDHRVLIKNVSIFNGTSKKLITAKMSLWSAKPLQRSSARAVEVLGTPR